MVIMFKGKLMKKKIKKYLSVLLLSFAAVFVFAQEADDPSETREYGKRNFVYIDSEMDYDLNPQTSSFANESQIFTALYEGLFSYNPVNLSADKALCRDVKISRDKKRWTFTLVDNGTFSDGEKITAQTVRDSWLRLLSNKDAPFASLLDCIVGAESYRKGKGSAEDVRISVRDDTTLVVHLTEPTEHLALLLCHSAFSVVSSMDNVYSGPFVLKSYENKTLEMVKNENYRDARRIYLPGITVIQSNDPDENAHMFNSGKVDWVSSSVNFDKIIDPDSIYSCIEFGTTYLFFKSSSKKWNTTEIRGALMEAIPYDKLRQGYACPATTLVYPLNGYPSVTGFSDYDLESAKEMMAEARKKAGIAEDEIITVTFAIEDNEHMKNWARILKAAWEPLGVKLVAQARKSSAYNAAIPKWKADLFIYSWIGDFADPLAFLELFKGNSTLNVANYSNAVYDDLIHQALSSSSAQEHYNLLGKAEQVLMDDFVVVPIAHPVAADVVDTAGIGGWYPNAMNIHPLKYVYMKENEGSSTRYGTIM